MAAVGILAPRGFALRGRATHAAGSKRPLASYGDGKLVALVADGNEPALGELYDRFAPAAHGLAHRVLRQQELAEDAVQEAFVLIWQLAGRFNSERGSVRNWVMMLVHRRAVDLVRATQRTRRQGEQEQPRLLAPSAADEGELNSKRRTVQLALASLTAKHRTVLELAYYGGYSQTEIATRLEIPLGTVKSQTYEALRCLQQLLDPVE